jgi:two-component system, chemotaxis family, sensor kinase CheA
MFNKKIFTNIITSGTFEEFSIGERSRLIFLNLVMIIGSTLLSLFALRDLQLTEYGLSIALFSIITVMIISFILLRVTKNLALISYVVVVVMFLLNIYLIYNVDVNGAGILWFLSYPIICIFLGGAFTGTVFSAVLFVYAAFIYLTGFGGYIPFTFDFVLRTLGIYIFIYVFCLTFEIIQRKTQSSLEVTSHDLKHEKKQTDSIMHNVEEGIFLLNSELLIESQYSDYFSNLFPNHELAKMNIIDLLENRIPEKDLNAAKDYLEMFFKKGVNPDLLKEINPLETISVSLDSDDKSFSEFFLAFKFSHIYEEDGSVYILCSVKDITEEHSLSKQLDEEAKSNAKSMENLFHIIHVDPKMMVEFLKESEEEMDIINSLLKKKGSNYRDLLVRVYQSIHSMKSNALILGIKKFSTSLHSVEDEISNIMSKEEILWDNILDIAITLRNIQVEINDINSLISKIIEFRTDFVESESSINKGIIEKSIERLLKIESKKLNKKVQLQFKNFNSSAIPDIYKKVIKDVFIQMSRNSIVHGIETPEVRISKNKKEYGVILISSEIKGDNIEYRFRDDGQGLDIKKIQAKLLENSTPSSSELKPVDIARHIFSPGFTTLDEATQVAGRGIGLSMIKERLEKFKGRIRINSSKDRMCEFSILLPVPEK